MTPRYVVAPRAAKDIVQIWRYIKSDRSREIADRIETVIRSKFALLADFPSSGHYRRDLTSEEVRFFPVYSYLIVYRPTPQPLQIIAVLDGRRDLAKILPRRT